MDALAPKSGNLPEQQVINGVSINADMWQAPFMICCTAATGKVIRQMLSSMRVSAQFRQLLHD